jgi:hypothetical protein
MRYCAWLALFLNCAIQSTISSSFLSSWRSSSNLISRNGRGTCGVSHVSPKRIPQVDSIGTALRFIQPEATRDLAGTVKRRLHGLAQVFSNGISIIEPLLRYFRKILWTRIIPALVIEAARVVAVGVVLTMIYSAVVRKIVERLSRESSDMGSALSIRPENSTVTFADVLGVDEAKEEMKEIIAYLKNPAKFTNLGGRLTKGILLTGDPGTGKTLLARAVAGEAGVPFFYKSGSEFDEMFVGVGAKRLRDLFKVAKQNSPCIVFIDEIETIGGSRESRSQRGHHHETLNQLLVELDGFLPNNGTIVIGATNFPSSLDAALVRPGRYSTAGLFHFQLRIDIIISFLFVKCVFRFDKKLHLPLPDIAGRKAILELYAKKVSFLFIAHSHCRFSYRHFSRNR